jgi:nicotinate-nucleotide adenylyltransferase
MPERRSEILRFAQDDGFFDGGASASSIALIPPMRLALYGGTFDPVHFGHLVLAREALEQLTLDRVIFIPAGLSPHKLATTPAPAALRREMLAAAIADEPGFALDDSELSATGPSFTIDTVERVRAAHPDAHIHYLIGADNLKELHTWRRIDDLRRLVEFVVLGRGDARPEAAVSFRTLARRIDISATEIRQRVARGQSIRYLVPEPVRSIIAAHHLYQESPHQL